MARSSKNIGRSVFVVDRDKRRRTHLSRFKRRTWLSRWSRGNSAISLLAIRRSKKQPLPRSKPSQRCPMGRRCALENYKLLLPSISSGSFLRGGEVGLYVLLSQKRDMAGNPPDVGVENRLYVPEDYVEMQRPYSPPNILGAAKSSKSNNTSHSAPRPGAPTRYLLSQVVLGCERYRPTWLRQPRPKKNYRYRTRSGCTDLKQIHHSTLIVKRNRRAYR